MNRSGVTVAIPTYDRLGYLREAVASAMAQTYAGVEVLIGQDPAGDHPDEGIREWCMGVAGHGKVRYQCNEMNLGLAGNWNALARSSQSDYIVIIGDDDRLLPGFAERLLSAGDGADVVFCNHYVIDGAGRRLEKEREFFTRRYHRDALPPGPLANPEPWTWRNAIPMSASLIRTEHVRRLGFREDLNTPEVEFFIRLAQEGRHFVFVPEYLAEYRIHRAAATSAGLTNERLVEYLLRIPAGAGAESDKRSLLSGLMVNAVSRHILQGERQEALRLLANGYYPPFSRAGLRSAVQRICAILPVVPGRELYRLLHSFKGLFSTR